MSGRKADHPQHQPAEREVRTTSSRGRAQDIREQDTSVAGSRPISRERVQKVSIYDKRPFDSTDEDSPLSSSLRLASLKGGSPRFGSLKENRSMSNMKDLASSRHDSTSFGNDRITHVSLAQHRWDLIRRHVRDKNKKTRSHGPNQKILELKNQLTSAMSGLEFDSSTPNDFDMISTLWRTVHQCCKVDVTSPQYRDSTVAFLHDAVSQATSSVVSTSHLADQKPSNPNQYDEAWEKVRRTSFVMAQLASTEPSSGQVTTDNKQFEPVPPAGTASFQRPSSRLRFATEKFLPGPNQNVIPSSLFGSVLNRVNGPAAPVSGTTSDKHEESSLQDSRSKKPASFISYINPTHIGNGLSIDGLTLDAIPGFNPFKTLVQLAMTLHKPKREITQFDFLTVQVFHNRAWKLLVLGLVQAEPLSRYIAMGAIHQALLKISDTLVDESTQANLVEKLVNITVSDERAENRSRAAHLLGQVVTILGKSSESKGLMDRAFKDLIKQFFEIQFSEKKGGDRESTFHSAKIHLIHVVGQFLKASQHGSKSSYEHLVLSLCFEEITNAIIRAKRRPFTPSIQNKEMACEVSAKDAQLLSMVLTVLTNDLPKTAKNKQYVGALFKSLVQPMMKGRHANLQKAAIQFISNWLPVANEDALLQGLERVTEGLNAMKSLNLNNFDDVLFNKRLEELQRMTYDEQCQVSLRMKLSRDLMQLPGTFSQLLPVPESPGFFCDANSTMFNSKSILVDLPIHAFSNVTLRRPIAGIPGVPKSVTTVPPLFIEANLAESLPQPRSQYEYEERTGCVPFLPFGYTCNPTPSPEMSEGALRSVTGTPSSTALNDTSDIKFNVIKNKSMWGASDEIPQGYSRQPPRSDADSTDGRKLPFGFNTVCPYPGFDMDKIDRESYPISPIYKRPIYFLRDGLRGEVSKKHQTLEFEDSDRLKELEEGCTFDRYPILWPPKDSRYLKSSGNMTDFPLGAPVVLDIIQPSSPKLQRILTRVSSIDRSLSNISVQRATEKLDPLLVGAKFNIYVRPRSNEACWTTIQLEVIDEDYDDEMNFESTARKPDLNSSSLTFSGQRATHHQYQDIETPFPVPSGFTALNEPYFSPPANFPPIPAGYTRDGIPFYGRNAIVKSHPSGLTSAGTRFYPSDLKTLPPDGSNRNILAGVDLNGHPFYVPRGFTIPQPSGFTVDGVPYYDLPSLLRHHGVMFIPSKIHVIHSDESQIQSWEDMLYSIYHDPKLKENSQQRRRIEAQFLSKLCSSLAESQPELKHMLVKAHGRPVDPSRRQVDQRLKHVEYVPSDINVKSLQNPTDIPDFLRKGTQFSHSKRTSMRLAVEPAQLEFQSIRTPVAKNMALRYRAGRGDHVERDFFVAVEPRGVFSINASHFRLQGEGVVEIMVHFTPSEMKSSRVEGSVHILDEFGKRLASCRLIAKNDSFFKVHTAALDFGWSLPNQQPKELFVLVQNLSESHITLNVSVQGGMGDTDENIRSKLPLVKEDAKGENPFQILSPVFKLTAMESKKLSVLYQPTRLGMVKDMVQITGPGGEIVSIPVVGFSGSPIVMFPENEDMSSLGAAPMTKYRSHLLRSFQEHNFEFGAANDISEEETAFLVHIVAAHKPQNESLQPPRLDFGICYGDSKSYTRVLTFVNLSENPMILSLYSHSQFVMCPTHVRVPPKMANAIEVTISGPLEQMKGNINTIIEIACPNFQNIALTVTAFIGQPIYFPVWEIAFFKVSRLGQEQTLGLSLINESQYDLKVCLDGLTLPKNLETTNYITSSISSNEDKAIDVPAFSSIPVQFLFHAKSRGTVMKSLILRIVHPSYKLINSAMNSKVLRLIGICIEPYFRETEEAPFDPNNIEFLLKWLSHQKLVTEEYPEEQKRRLLDYTADTDSTDIGPYGVTFLSDTYISEVQALAVDDPLTITDLSAQTVSNQILTVQNRDDFEHQIRLFASTYFSLDPRNKILLPQEVLKIDNHFNIPQDLPRLATMYGFAIALDDWDQNFASIQLVRRHAGVLLLPIMGSDRQSIIDFGRIELNGDIMRESSRFIIISNPHSTAYIWNIKFMSSKSKLNPFSAPALSGEIAAFDTFAIPFKFSCDVSGLYEHVCEITVTDAMDKSARAIRMGTFTFRGIAVSTQLSGVPDFLDFGTIFVSTEKQKSFRLVNNGSSEVHVTSSVKMPFSLDPSSFVIPPRSSQEVDVRFRPTEAKPFYSQLLVFANQIQFAIPLSGSGGNARLVCEKYQELPLNFGPQKENTIAWCSIYLTNQGTLPLALKQITTDVPRLIKIQFVDVVPTNSISTNGRETFAIQNDYWGLLKRKMSLFDTFNKISADNRVMTQSDNYAGVGDSSMPFETGSGIALPVDLVDSSLPEKDVMSKLIPILKPFQSYHLKIGYVAKYGATRDCDICFHYTPKLPEAEMATVSVSKTELSVTGTFYRRLDIFPPFLDFGMAPAERFLKSQPKYSSITDLIEAEPETFEIPQIRDGVLLLHVLNSSRAAQRLKVISCPPEFVIQGRDWIVEPGHKFSIPVEFHPPKEQIQYHGNVVLQHTHGISMITVMGTGASAEVVADPIINFGSLKRGSSGIQKLSLHNKGLLATPLELEIFQDGDDFHFIGDDPYEYEGIIEPGETKIIDLKCECQNITGSSAEIQLRWKQIPRASYEKVHIPINVQIGYPSFRMQNTELDFQTVYMEVNKTIDFRLYNDGNAACLWRAQWDNQAITIEPSSGSIPPHGALKVQFTYVPTQFETLSCPVQFFTDSGNFTLMCSGVVGVPYLRIGAKDADFGIVTVDHSHSKILELKNTGTRPIEYELVMMETTKNGIQASINDTDIFYAEPSHGIIEPGTTKIVTVTIQPKDYGVVYSASYMVRTKDGEQYKGKLTAQGGKAIIKIKPPIIQTGDPRSALKPEETSKGSKFFKDPKTPLSQQDTSRLFLQSHIDNLYEVLAGLRAAESDMIQESMATTENNTQGSRGQQSHSVPRSRKGSGSASHRNSIQLTSGKAASRKTSFITSGGMKQDGNRPGRDAPSMVQSSGDTQKSENPDTHKSLKRDGSFSSVSHSQQSAEYLANLDGSHVKPMSRGTVGPVRSSALVNTGDSASYMMQESKSAKFTDELSQLERELEMAIGLRDPGASIIGLSSAILSADDQLGESLTKPISPSKKQSGGLGKYQPGRRRGLRLPKESIDQYHNVEATIKSNEKDSFSRTDTVSGAQMEESSSGGSSRQTTPNLMPGSRSTLTPKEEMIAKSLTSRGFLQSPPSLQNQVLTEVRAQKSQLENIISAAQELALNKNATLDAQGQKELIDLMNDRLMENTRAIMKTVNDQLTNDKWIPNREFLQQALRKLQQTTVAFEEATKPRIEEEPLEENSFNLGLIRGGDKSESVLLFSIPNEGNIPFEYQILSNPKKSVYPPLKSVQSDQPSLFQIDPSVGTLAPGNSVNISASFQAVIPGLYKQGFSVVSNDEDILAFTVIAKVGIPNLIVEPSEIDFGLIERGNTARKSFRISNTGGYKDMWRIVQEKEGEYSTNPFKLSIDTAETQPGEHTDVVLTFSPREEGEYASHLKIMWAKQPLTVSARGVGGGARLEFSYEDSSDKTFGGLDFGICPVGMKFTKTFVIRNTGTVTASVEISHPHPAVSLKYDLGEGGRLLIEPRKTLTVHATVSPEKTEIIKDPILFNLGSSGSQHMNFKARCGTHDWKPTGQLNFPNLPINEPFNCNIKIGNNGSLDIPLNIIIEPQEIRPFVHFATVNNRDWTNGRAIRPGTELEIEVIAKSSMPRIIEGKLLARTKLREENVEHDFPFKFRVFIEEVAVDDTADVAVGRVMIGDTAKATRNVTNFGNVKVKYRARIENAHDRDSSAWIISSNQEGVLDPNQSVAIEATFASIPGKGDGWQEAKLVVERLKETSEGQEEWVPFSELRLIGAAGHPELKIVPEQIDFGLLGLGATKRATIQFHNDGNAILNYDIDTWGSPDEFRLTDETNKKGSVQAGNSKPIEIMFTPTSERSFSSTVTVQTLIGERSFKLFGEGVSYRLDKSYLPAALSFGTMKLGEIKSLEVPLRNGCYHEIQVEATILKIDEVNNENDDFKADYLSISPAKMRLKSKALDQSKPFMALLEAMAPLQMDYKVHSSGVLDSDFVKNFPLNTKLISYIHLTVSQGTTEIIPVDLEFFISPLVILDQEVSDDLYDVSGVIKTVDFGTASLDSGSKRTLYLYNPNAFAVHVRPEIINTEYYDVVNGTGIIPSCSSKEIIFQLKACNIPEDAVDVPKSIECQGEISLLPHLESLPKISIPVTGVLVDKPPELEVPEVLHFGNVFRQKSSRLDLSFINPARRPLNWELTIDSAFADIFSIVSASKGTTGPKKMVNMSLDFLPKVAVGYEGTAFLTTDAGSFAIKLIGNGVQPIIEIDCPTTHFGVVGMDAPEYREIAITNPTILPLRVRVRSDNSSFLCDYTEIELKAGQTKSVKVFYNPQLKSRQEAGKISFFNLDDTSPDDEEEIETVIRVGKKGFADSKPTSPRKELERLKDVTFDGVGGDLKLLIEGKDVSKTSFPAGLKPSTASRSHVSVVESVQLTVSKMNRHQKVRRVFEIANGGDTVLELGIFDSSGLNSFEDGKSEWYSDQNRMRYKVSPANMIIHPHGKEKVTVTVEGLDSGEDTFAFMVRTKNHLNPKATRVQVSGKVLSASADEALQAFVRADSSIETTLNYALQEEEMYASERDIWKVLLPIVRISPYLPSMEGKTVPMVSPNVTRPDIGPYLVRPPAIPAILPQKTRKWYMNRVSMPLDSGRNPDGEITEAMIRRQEALHFIQPLEKKVYLEKKRDI